MNNFIRWTKKAYLKKLIVMLLLMSNILTGCTNLVTGEVKEKPIDWTDVDDKSGITALGLKGSDRVRVKINYGDAADFEANKYSALYLDAFYVAPDLSNDLENVSYFELLDTFENKDGLTTFVYAYRTRKYAGSKERKETESYKSVSEEGVDFVMYPEVKEDSKLPASEEVYFVLATYTFEQGRSSYHEIARVVNKDAAKAKTKKASDTEDKYCYAKTSYTKSGNDYKAKYYSLLDDTTLYVFDADNVKEFAKNSQPCCRLSSGKYETVVANEGGQLNTGNNGKKDYAYTTGYGTSNLDKVTKDGFSKCVDFADEFKRLTGSDAYKAMIDNQFGKNWTMDIYDYSIYTTNKEMNICFDLTVTSSEYKAPDESEFEDPLNPDGTPKQLDADDEDEMTDEEIQAEQKTAGKGNWSYDFVGSIVIKDLSDTTLKFGTSYYLNGGNYKDLDYMVFIYDYADENGEPLERLEKDEIRSIVGRFGFVVNPDGSKPLNMIRRPPKSGFFVYYSPDNQKYWGFPSNYGYYYTARYYQNGHKSYDHIGDITAAYDYRDADSKSYGYKNKEYLLVSADYYRDPSTYNSAIESQDEDGNVYNTIITNNYLVGNMELASTKKFIEEHVAQPKDGGVVVRTGPFEATVSNHVLYNAIPGLRMEMKNGVLHSMLMYQPNNDFTGKYIYDNYAVFRKKDRVTHLTNLTSVPYSTLLNLGYLNFVNTDLLSPNDKTGNLQNVEPVLIGKSLYLYYIYENAIEIVDPKVNGNDFYSQLYSQKKSPSYFRRSGNSFYKYIDTTKFCINKDFQTREEISISVNNLTYFDSNGKVISENKVIDSMDNLADDSAVKNIHTDRLNNSAGFNESFYFEGTAITKDDVNHNGSINKEADPGITAEYTIEGIVYRDKNGKDIGKLTYDQAIEVVSGKKAISAYITNASITDNWINKTKLATKDGKSLYDSLKDNGLAYRYAIELEDAGNSVIKYYIYDTTTGVLKEIVNGEFNNAISSSKTEDVSTQVTNLIKSKCPATFEKNSWNSIANYIASKVVTEKKTEYSGDYKPLEGGEYFKANNISFFEGNFENKTGSVYKYIVSSTPKYGLGLLKVDSDTPILPTFQRHEIVKKVTHIIEMTNGEETGAADKTAISDDVRALSNMACYGIYENHYTKDKDIYPYYFMGYDRDNVSYTSAEMLRAKMVPFGVAFYDESKDERVNPSASLNASGKPIYNPNTDGSTGPEHRYGYYRDFLPIGNENCVFYLRDAFFEPNGNMVVDRNIFDGDDTKDDDNDPVGPTPTPSINPGPTVDPNPSTSPVGPSIDPNPSVNPNPSGTPGPVGPSENPNPSSGPVGPSGNPNPSSGPVGPSGNPNPSSGPVGPSGNPNPSSAPVGPSGNPNPSSAPVGPSGNPNPSSAPVGPSGNPNPSSAPVGPSGNPNPSSGPVGPSGNPNPYPSGNGDNGNGGNGGGTPGGNSGNGGDYGYSGYDGAGNSGFNGIVTDNTGNIPSIFDKNANNNHNNADNDNSASNNGVSDNSLSDNSLSDNSLSDNSLSDNSISDDSISDGNVSGNGIGNGNGNDGKLPWWVLLLIIIALMIIAYVVYRKKNGLPIIPDPVREFFAGIFVRRDKR